MTDLQNIVYVIRSLTCNSLYMPPYLRFVLTAEKRDSKASQFDLLVKLLQTKKIYEVFDTTFFESESYSLLDFVHSYTEQQRQSSARRSTSQNTIAANEATGAAAANNETETSAPASKAEKDKLIKLLRSKS